MNEMMIFPREYLDRLRWKLILRVLWVHHFTGVWAAPSHPFLRSNRFCFSSAAPKGTLVARHLPHNTRRINHAS